jgi:transcriptional regulator with XRE-family HTH domain
MNTGDKNIRLIFGLKLKQLRIDQKHSLSSLSKATGISVSYLNEIEKGKKYPKEEKIKKLSEALNVDFEDLVSIRLKKNLSPISQLIETNVLNELPLDFFGINQSELLELLSEAPTKLSAFIDSIIQIAKKYDIQVEQFFYSVLRSYQEMHDNYFPELESAARKFSNEYNIVPGSHSAMEPLRNYLTEECGYTIVDDGLSKYPQLGHLRYLWVKQKDGKIKLLLNPLLTTTQKLFILGREAGFNYLELEDRSVTSSWLGDNTFDQVLNNFKAYYFASALILHEKIFLRGLMNFISTPKFDRNGVIRLINGSASSPEVFLLRITNLVPRYLKFNDLFFFRYNHDRKENIFHLTKEMYASGLRHVPRFDLISKACQRYAALDALKAGSSSDERKSSVYNITFENSGMNFLIVGIFDNMNPTRKMNSYIGVGFLINKRFREKARFVDDPNIPKVKVDMDWIMTTSDNCLDGLENVVALKRENYLHTLREQLQEVTDAEQG